MKTMVTDDDKRQAMEIQNHAVLVRVSLKKPGASKTDKSVSEVTAQAHDGSVDYFPGSKKLFISQTYKDISKLDGHIRNNIIAIYTMPWTDKGTRMCPTKVLTKLRNELRSTFDMREELIRKLAKEYDDVLAQAKIGLGTAYRDSDYKPKEEFINAFSHKFDVETLTYVDDLRLKLPDDQIQQIKKDVEDKYKKALEVSMLDMHSRLSKILQATADGLERHGEMKTKKKGKFNDFTIHRLQEIVGLLPAMNVTSDPALDRVHQTLEAILEGITPKELREDDDTRNELQQKVAQAKDLMQGVFGNNKE